MSEKPRPLGRLWFWAGLVLTAWKLWLTRAQPVYAIGGATHDDRLFLQLADSIVRGEWLGSYSQMTLAKGAFYPIWIAALFTLGLPLLFGMQLAYAGACALVVRACRPAIRSGAALLAIYAFLLWNPMSFESPTLGRVIRQQIYTPLELVVLAGLIALHLRRAEPLRRGLPWTLLAGLAFGCFWLTREESIWLVPSVALLAAAPVFCAWREKTGGLRPTLLTLGAGGLAAALPVFVVAAKNHAHYGWFGTCEFHAAEFNDAYGAMVRVRVGPELNHVPVSREARLAMYQVSPTFAKLQPFLEGDIGRGWADASSTVTKLPPDERQIGSGWMMWALRDAVAAAGYCHNAREALDFYARMAGEINRACDSGKLPADGRRSGFLPRARPGQTREVLATLWSFTDFVAGYKSFSAHPLPSIGSEDDVLLFRDLSRDEISASPAISATILPDQLALNTWKLAALHHVGKALRPLMLWLFLAALPLLLVRLVQLARRRDFSFPLVVAAAAGGGALAYLLINALVQVTSFSVIAVSTFWPIYPLLQLFTVAVFWDAAAAWLGSAMPPAAKKN